MLDTLMHAVVPTASNSAEALRLLKSQLDLRAYKVAENVFDAATDLSRIGSLEGRQVVYDAMRLETLQTPMWMESWNPAVNAMEAFLIEAPVDSRWAVSFFVQDGEGYIAKARAFTLQRDEHGSMRVTPNPSLVGRAEVVDVAHFVMALLAIGSAPMLTDVLYDKPPRQGMIRFHRLRMAEPWADVDRNGIPRLGKAARPSSVADELLDEMLVLEARIWRGVHQFDTAEQREKNLRQLEQKRRAILGAMRLVLSPLTAAAAADVAEAERGGMDAARSMVVLPDFLTWIEWRDTSCGIPGQRFGVVMQAKEDDAPRSDVGGLIFALPADWTLNRDSFRAMPMLSFELRLASTDKPLIEVTDISGAMSEIGEMDAARLGRFLLAVLTFISQPRMSEQVEVARDSTRQAVDKVREKRRLAPQVGMKEVRLVIDLPRDEEVSADEPADGQIRRPVAVVPGGMPLHRVRMFWRWRLGRLEVVRPHFRGSLENGVSRRVTLLLHPDEVGRPLPQPLATSNP
ncbi:hypothetical protein [Falsiroseomonas sp. CW058]|uniref:hypothetical protein n=1 Tax=Falsiroseomonas sp. CW058 TaxID=3388664 RepID=UPI003D3129D6